MAEGSASTQDWMLEQLLEDGPILTVTDQLGPQAERSDSQRSGDVDGAVASPDNGAERVVMLQDGDAPAPHDLDGSAAVGEQAEPDVNRGAKRTAVWLGCGAAVAAVLIVVAFVGFGGGPAPVSPPQHRATIAAVAAAPTTNVAVPQQDQAVPFTPWSTSCTPDGGAGDQLAARSPVALTDAATDSAWVCGRGPQESRLDGQVLHVQFVCDPSRPNSACSYMLNSLSVTPGWVAKTQGGKDEWLQHRVVTNVQFNFFNGNELVTDPLPVDTHSVHGPVSVTLPRKVLVSRVDVIILHTDRPPANPLPTSPASGPAGAPSEQPPNGLVDSLMGAPGGDPAAPPPADPAGAPSSPVDATFAMSQLQFFGHSPN
ncbi:hypothetical protein OK015_28530 (plasmid) [Mycobacterium sp. Aquia_216]|uniref:hypothetical protein n=1 Tax=Mycobacterium sp. Aquia_216 TaxID=2991729 RepID=UPI00227ABE57|nr:hypothetical protein [Mycobacterium sp. Aquia_216]WAJ47996.1 hypothetical protein OK015_28530 [Mycobacterium sp. Aquia_216]